MKLAIMQPYFFPYIGYWQLINAVDTFIIYDDVTYIKSGFINRNSILINNQSNKINIKILGASSYKQINQLKKVTNDPKPLKTIRMAYSKAPYFEVIFPIIEKIINHPENNLAKYLGYSIDVISNFLKINSKLIYSSDIKKSNDLKSQEKILNICSNLGATNYINSIGGRALYCKEQFHQKNITLHFLQTKLINYRQFDNEFVANLSMIDVMMFNKVEDIRIMLQNYKLV
ncbi:MAG: WbqC family protein [Methylococcales bacterium]|nr:WbqC family protein [Methylococcales bacterium]MBT7410190.1 WbqC family protein [Methylococcales bacterium]